MLTMSGKSEAEVEVEAKAEAEAEARDVARVYKHRIWTLAVQHKIYQYQEISHTQCGSHNIVNALSKS